nr:hypothetical protein [uncultured Campylobacter sp.]
MAKFYSPRCKIPIFYPKPHLLAQTRTIKFTPLLYDFVLSAQHFIAAETMYFRRGAISSPYSLPNKRRLNSSSKCTFKISSGPHTPYARLARYCVKFCRAIGSAIQISPAVSEVPPAR